MADNPGPGSARLLRAYKRGEIRRRMRTIGVLRRLGPDDDPLPNRFLKLDDSSEPVTLDEVREMLSALGWSLEEMK